MAYKDFSKKVYEKRIVKIDDQKIDVSRIPTRVMLKLAELKDRGEELRAGGIETFMELVKIISLACSKNKKITPDWLIDHTDIEMLTELLEFIVEPLTKIAEKAEKKAKKLSKK